VANTTFIVYPPLCKRYIKYTYGRRRCPGAAEKQLRGGWPRLSRVHMTTYKHSDRHTNKRTNKHKHKTNTQTFSQFETFQRGVDLRSGAEPQTGGGRAPPAPPPPPRRSGRLDHRCMSQPPDSTLPLHRRILHCPARLNKGACGKATPPPEPSIQTPYYRLPSQLATNPRQLRRSAART
jgi:hypothetical protein